MYTAYSFRLSCAKILLHPWLFQALEEVMRLYPAAVVQKMVPPGGLSLKGYDVPAGTTTMVSAITNVNINISNYWKATI